MDQSWLSRVCWTAIPIVPGRLGLVGIVVGLHSEAGQREVAALCSFGRWPFLHLPGVTQAASGPELNVLLE